MTEMPGPPPPATDWGGRRRGWPGWGSAAQMGGRREMPDPHAATEANGLGEGSGWPQATQEGSHPKRWEPPTRWGRPGQSGTLRTRPHPRSHLLPEIPHQRGRQNRRRRGGSHSARKGTRLQTSHERPHSHQRRRPGVGEGGECVEPKENARDHRCPGSRTAGRASCAPAQRGPCLASGSWRQPPANRQHRCGAGS